MEREERGEQEVKGEGERETAVLTQGKRSGDSGADRHTHSPGCGVRWTVGPGSGQGDEILAPCNDHEYCHGLLLVCCLGARMQSASSKSRGWRLTRGARQASHTSGGQVG